MYKKYICTTLLIVATTHANDVYVYTPKDKKILPYTNGGDAEVRYCTDGKMKKQNRDEAYDTISNYCGGGTYTITSDVHGVFGPRSGANEMLEGCKGPGHILAFKCTGSRPSGQWDFFPADGQGSCMASYTQKNGTVSIISPDNDLQNGGLIFSGSNIPKPSKETNVKVSLTQNKAKTVTVNAINGVFIHTPSGEGSVKIPVENFEGMLSGMQDTQTFKIVQNNKTWISIDWTKGKRIKEKLTDCYVKSILYK